MKKLHILQFCLLVLLVLNNYTIFVYIPSCYNVMRVIIEIGAYSAIMSMMIVFAIETVIERTEK